MKRRRICFVINVRKQLKTQAAQLKEFAEKPRSVHLALLYLGIKNTHVGPTFPAWLTPNLLKTVQELFGVQIPKTVEEDMRIFELV